MNLRTWNLFLILIFISLANIVEAQDSLGTWIQFQSLVSKERMLRNISPADAVPGIVIASPSRQSPDYRYHWTRDSSLVMDQVVWLFRDAPDNIKSTYLKYLTDFISLANIQQQTPSAEGLGEPRYLVNGIADTTPWARPQYDGPALRAQTLIHFLNIFKGENTIRLQAINVLRTDLQFVLLNWKSPCFDLWEELKGLHFYTQSVQYAALNAGAEFFKNEGDLLFSEQLTRESTELKIELEKYWDESRGYIGASRNLEVRPSSPHYKEANLDVSVILGALHGQGSNGILSFNDDRLLATAHAIEMAFGSAYRINQDSSSSSGAVAIGRFTDDVYYGGNPWYITTAAFAELYYRIAETIKLEGGIVVTKNNLGFLKAVLPSLDAQNLKSGEKILSSSVLGQQLLSGLSNKGDAFLAIVRKYAGSQGELAEQFDRDAGVPVSAYDLTWSYASFLSAINFYKLP